MCKHWKYICVSARQIIKYGVPQGAILGPIIIHINDLFILEIDWDNISFIDDIEMELKKTYKLSPVYDTQMIPY